jgi:hypothetical protein
VPGSILAAVTPDNTPGGAVLTFAFPLGLFIVVAVALYLRFARPHRRVPEALAPAQASPAVAPPAPGIARGASVAAGLPTAVGSGGAESPVEPAGGVRKAADNGTGDSAADAGPSNVSGQESDPADGDDGGPGPDSGGKASE